MSSKSRHMPQRAKFRAREFKYQPTDAKTVERRNLVWICSACIVGIVISSIVFSCVMLLI